MAAMAALRLAFILFLSVGLDLMPASALESLEVFEESEEAFHRSRGRRVAHRAWEIARLPVARRAPAALVLPGRRVPERVRRPLAGGLLRKVPPPVSDPPSASEDH
jgi:hypothetical protein